MSPEPITILLGALTVFVGSTIVFGHRYADKCSKFDEKSKIDELNEVRIEMRADTTVSALDKIWRFLLDINRQMRAKDQDMKIDILLIDTTTRKYFNKLINDLEQTFRDSMKVRNAWDNLRVYYGKLGKILYWFAAIEGLAGYPLLLFGSQLNPFLTLQQYYIWGGVLFILAIIFMGLIVYVRRKISHNSNIYNEIKKKYLIDEVKIGK